VATTDLGTAVLGARANSAKPAVSSDGMRAAVGAGMSKMFALVATLGPICVFRLWWIWWTRPAADASPHPVRWTLR